MSVVEKRAERRAPSMAKKALASSNISGSSPAGATA
jgi:hypothetical protein